MWTRGLAAVTALVIAAVLGYAWLPWVAYAWWVTALFLIEASLLLTGSWYLQARMTSERRR